MRFPFRRIQSIALLACALTASPLALTACGRGAKTFDVSRPQLARVALLASSGPAARPADTFGAAGLALAVRWDNDRRWILAVAEAAVVAQRTPPQPSAVVSAPVSAPTDLAGVMQCIKDHESGNYAEQSHPSGASGAYQYMPETWRTWSERAGFPGFDYAYQAPPEVQDAVTVHTLTNGGAGNWSPRYGDDPCTVGLGG